MSSPTRPSWMRSASPSAIAVFPTPVSPTRIGLFFRRRARIWTIRSSSRARPISGSSFPWAARAVRSVAKAASGSAGTSASPAPSVPVGVRISSAPPAPAFEMPCEMYCRTSSREMPCPRSSAVAYESGSWKIAATRSPASTSAFSALSQCRSAFWSTR